VLATHGELGSNGNDSLMTHLNHKGAMDIMGDLEEGFAGIQPDMTLSRSHLHAQLGARVEGDKRTIAKRDGCKATHGGCVAVARPAVGCKPVQPTDRSEEQCGGDAEVMPTFATIAMPMRFLRRLGKFTHLDVNGCECEPFV